MPASCTMRTASAGSSGTAHAGLEIATALRMRAAVETVKAAVHEVEDRMDGELEKDVRKVETANALGGILRIASCLHPLAIPAGQLTLIRICST